jgi:hypothetical protein
MNASRPATPATPTLAGRVPVWLAPAGRSILFVSLPFVIFALIARDVIFGNKVLSLYLDNTYIFHPLFHSVSEIFSRGETPFWIKELLGGLPIYNTPQFSIWYPFYFFGFGLYKDPVSAIFDSTNVTCLHLVIMMFSMIFFLRVLGSSRAASIFGGVTLTFSACMATHLVFTVVMAAYSWLPLGLAGLHLIAIRNRPWEGMAITIVGMSLGAMANPAQPLIHVIILAAIHLTAALVYVVRNEGMRRVPRIVVPVLFATICTVGVVAPNLVTMTLGQSEQIRWLGSAGHMIGNGPIPFEAFHEDQQPAFDLLHAIVPFRATNLAGDTYVGVTILCLALLGFLLRRRSEFALAYFFTAAYFLLSATGSNLGFSTINHKIPLINLIREPTLNLSLYIFAVATLAAFGLDELIALSRAKLGDTEARRKLILFLSLAIILGGVGSVVAIFLKQEQIRLVLIAASLLLAGFVTAKYLAHRGILIVGPYLITLFAVSAWYVETPKWRGLELATNDYADYENLRIHGVLKYISKLPSQELYKTRIDADARGPDTVMRFAMNSMWHGVRTFNAWINPLPSYQTFAEITDFGNRDPSFYRMLGAKYLICSKCVEAEKLKLHLLGNVEGYKVYADEGAQPYYSIIRPVPNTQTPEAVSQWLNSFQFEPRTATVDPAIFSLWGNAYQQRPECVSVPERLGHNSMTFSASCRVPGVFVLNELYSKNWIATLNGKSMEPIRVNNYQIGIPLQAGPSILNFRFAPSLYRKLLYVALLALFGLVCVMSVAAFRLLKRSTWQFGRDRLRSLKVWRHVVPEL